MINRQNSVLRCTGCGREYPFGTYTCEKHDGVLLAEYDLGKARSVSEIETPSQQGIWWFSEALPNVADPVSLAEGGTPCLCSINLGSRLGLTLYIKDEGRNPTGSFKDRAATLLISTERALGHSSCATASSGNAAGALALYARLGGMHLHVFMYQPTREKLLHTSSFSPSIYLINTPVESDVHRLTEEACAQFGWASLTTMSSANPFNIEGYKTISYEIVRDVGLPDIVVLPIGSGTLGLGVWKGFKELYEMGITGALPRLVGVQPENVAPIVEAYERGETDVHPVTPKKTVATGTVVDNPGIAGTVTLQAVRESGGWMIGVSEDKILEAWSLLPTEEGVFAEPTGALSVAGMMLAREYGKIKAGETVVCLNSASGFKDLSLFEAKASDSTQVFHLLPNLEAIAKIKRANNGN